MKNKLWWEHISELVDTLSTGDDSIDAESSMDVYDLSISGKLNTWGKTIKGDIIECLDVTCEDDILTFELAFENRNAGGGYYIVIECDPENKSVEVSTADYKGKDLVARCGDLTEEAFLIELLNSLRIFPRI